MARVIVTGSFDNLRSRDVRFLEEASKLGELDVLLWSDQAARTATGAEPKFPQQERLYFLRAIRYVHDVKLTEAVVPSATDALWAVRGGDADDEGARHAHFLGIRRHIIAENLLDGFPLVASAAVPTPGREKVLVTGCYDWLHTGHVRFFEEVSGYGDVYAVVGHDANVALLKGSGHPHFNQDERRYMVQSLRSVKQSLVSTGTGWLDAEPEIQRIRPDIYAVNEDGDKPAKKEYCEKNGIEYLVLKRTPKEGLATRSSTALRGF